MSDQPPPPPDPLWSPPPPGAYGGYGPPRSAHYGPPEGPPYGVPQYPPYGSPQNAPYGAPQYPPSPAAPPYGPAGPPQDGVSPSTRGSVLGRIGHRAARRPQPRLGVTLAGTGVALVILGVLVWGGGHVASGVADSIGTGGLGGGGSRNVLGVLLALAVTIAGYAVAMARRTGPLVTAGVAASALGVPVMLGFATFDASGGRGLPFSQDVVVLVSVAAWVVSYLLLPTVRGHAFYLGLTVVTIWVYALEKADSNALANLLFGPVITAVDQAFGSGSVQTPDYLTLGLVSLVFGLCYFASAAVSDRRGRSGLAHPFVIGGFVATSAGLTAMANEWHEVGTGISLLLVGGGLARYGSVAGRRFTTWAGGLAVGIGVVLLIAKAVSGNFTAAGVGLIVVGLAVVGAAHLVARALDEPDEMATTSADGETTAAPVH